MRSVTCNYCGKPAELVPGRTVYPHRTDLHELLLWRCVPCDAQVGCHRAGARVNVGEDVLVDSDGTIPLGRLANAPLRSARVRAHDLFERLWLEGRKTRTQAYGWMAAVLGIHPDSARFALLEADQCWALVDAIEALIHDAPTLAGKEAAAIQPDLAPSVNESPEDRRVAIAPDWLARAGLRFEAQDDGEHLVVASRGTVIDFWPRTQVWKARGADLERQGLHPLIKYCKGL
ncbi:zinc-finger-containing protein [Pelomonas sp. SE-A7]|uniref:zinc-finger-containing protein n=1 Tax=Pelomonas sp. SE-A7 TaxID=3054953 RepID=UPI00339037D4